MAHGALTFTSKSVFSPPEVGGGGGGGTPPKPTGAAAGNAPTAAAGSSFRFLRPMGKCKGRRRTTDDKYTSK